MCDPRSQWEDHTSGRMMLIWLPGKFARFSSRSRPRAHFGMSDSRAVPERMEIKQAVFAELDACTPGHAILASNTSSLSITEIGDATLRPDRVVGFHYFYPASIMPLIEIVEGDETSAETLQATVTFAQAIKKQPITCLEVPGFVVNRILNSGISEVWRAQEEGDLSIKAIDEGVGAANVVPVGPYHLVNLLGLDTVLHVAELAAPARPQPLGRSARRRQFLP